MRGRKASERAREDHGGLGEGEGAVHWVFSPVPRRSEGEGEGEMLARGRRNDDNDNEPEGGLGLGGGYHHHSSFGASP